MSEIGATGEFPQGKLTASDKGELGIKVFSVPGTIVVEFGALITWIGMDPEGARNLADSLRRHADAAERAALSGE
jgi:hypothetical protein